MGKQNYGIDAERLSDYARQIKEVHDMGVQILPRLRRRL